MAHTSLVTHCGARTVTQTELEAVTAPAPTRTWFPLSHGTVLSRVKETLGSAGFEVSSTKLALTRGDARFFGVLDLKSVVVNGVTLAVGVRNSIDKSLPIAFCAGHRVFVCDNLAFRSEITVARKHTRHGEIRFGEALSRATQSLSQFQTAERARINRFQLTQITETEGDALLLRMWEKDILSHRLLPCAVRQWRQSDYAEFQNRNFWSLYNAATFALADREKTNPQQFAHLTIRLSDLLNDAAGVLPEETFAMPA